MTGRHKEPPAPRPGRGTLTLVSSDTDTVTVPVSTSLTEIMLRAQGLVAVLREAERRPQVLDAALRSSLVRAAERIRRDLERIAA